MTTLSGKEVAGYYHAAGFSGQNLITMVAISKSESGWNTAAHNSTPPDDSYGLSQINMIGSLGPSRRAQFNLKDNSNLFNPVVNAHVAFALSGGGTNFGPWSTYTSGAFRNNIPAATQAVADLQAAGPQFEHDLIAKASSPASGLTVLIDGLAVGIGAGLFGPGGADAGAAAAGPVNAGASAVGSAVSSVPDAIKNAANAVTAQFAAIGGNFIAIGVALVLLILGVLLLSHNSIGAAVKAVRP